MVRLFALGVSIPLFLLLFWVLSRPQMWNFSKLIASAPTSTPVPKQAPMSSATGLEWIAVLALFALSVGAFGLIALGVFWLWSRKGTRPQPQPPATPKTRVLGFQPTGPVAPTLQRSPEPPITAAGQPNREIPVEPRTDESIVEKLPVSVLVSQSKLPRVRQEEELGVEAHKLMKPFERSFFWALRHALGDDYYIFPQIPLRELVPESGSRQIPRDLKWMLYKGVVDFVLVDPTSLRAKLACEFDDPSHDLADAKARDRRKDEFLRMVGLPVARFPSKGNWEAEALRKFIQDAMVPDCAVPLLDELDCQLFRALLEARADMFVFPRVGMRSLVYHKRFLPPEIFKTWDNETVDFVLAHPKYLGTAAVVDIGGSPNDRRSRLFREAGIPVVYCDPHAVPTAADLRALIAQVLWSNSARAGDAKP